MLDLVRPLVSICGRIFRERGSGSPPTLAHQEGGVLRPTLAPYQFRRVSFARRLAQMPVGPKLSTVLKIENSRCFFNCSFLIVSPHGGDEFLQGSNTARKNR